MKGKLDFLIAAVVILLMCVLIYVKATSLGKESEIQRSGLEQSR